MWKLVYNLFVQIPRPLEQLAKTKSGARWLKKLPSVVSEVAKQWELEVGLPYSGGSASYVASATRNGHAVVLKIQWPHEECTFEVDALKAWAGEGAVKLLAHNRERHALLLEHCSPGTYLPGSECKDKLAEIVALLPRLWLPARAPFKSLEQEANSWADSIYKNWENARHPCDREMIELSYRFLRMLASTQGEQVLVNQDLHGENILAAQREPWLVIDPKPLNGEREFGLASVVRSFELGHSRDEVIGRLDRSARELGLDRERARMWSIAQTVAWCFDSSFRAKHLQTAKWLIED